MNKVSASRIKELRIQQGLSQEKLAEETGLNLRTIQRIENGETEPLGHSIKKIAQVLDIAPEELIDLEHVKKNKYLSPMKIFSFSTIGVFVVAILFFACSTEKPYAKATFEFEGKNHTADLEIIRALLPQNDSSVILRSFQNSGLYEIGVHDSDPQLAANRANQLVVMLETKLTSSSGESFKLWKRAEPPTAAKP